MKKFLFNIVGFAIAVLLILHLFKSTLPFYWGNEELCDKMELFESDEAGFDLVYFGPSAVKREFIPSVFENSLKDTSLRAFNFGTAGVYYAEQDFLVRHAMSDESFSDVSYVLSFGQDPKKIMDAHFHKLRIKYALDWSSYVSCFEYFYWKRDFQQVYRYTIMFLENQLFIGEIFEMFQWHFNDYGVPDDLHDKAGYVPYEWSVANNQKSRNQQDKFLDMLDGDEYMPGHRKKTRTKNGIKKPSRYDEVLVRDLIELDRLAKKKGMRYLAVYEPNMNDFISLDSLRVLYFGDGKDYQEYFEVENRWDHKHLNEKGAIFHTQRLASLFEGEVFGSEKNRANQHKGGQKKKKKKKKKKGKNKKKKAKDQKSKKDGVKSKKKDNGRKKGSKSNKRSKKKSKKKSRKKE